MPYGLDLIDQSFKVSNNRPLETKITFYNIIWTKYFLTCIKQIANNWSKKQIFGRFESGCFTQVLL